MSQFILLEGFTFYGALGKLACMNVPVCVIIPAYNAQATLAEALQSVACQTVKPAEVIVVDDGSTDGTLNCAKSVSFPLFVPITVLSQPNAGVSVARNRALRLTQQPVVAFLDADDQWHPTKLEKAYTAFLESGSTLLAHAFTVDRAGAHTTPDIRPRLHRAPTPLESLYLGNFLCTSTLMATREALLQAGGFPEGQNQSEDYDLWLKVLETHPEGLHVLPESLTLWRDTPGSLSTKATAIYKADLKIALRHYPALRRHTRWAPLRFLQRIVTLHVGYWRLLVS